MPKKSKRQRARRAKNRLRQRCPIDNSVVYKYPVYRRAVVLGEQPLMEIDKATRDIWLEQGAVIQINGGKAVRLLLNLPPRPQQSVKMGPSIVEGNAEGKEYAQACVAAWRPRYRAA